VRLPVRQEARGEIDVARGDRLAGQGLRIRRWRNEPDHRHAADGGGFGPVARDAHGDRGGLPYRLQPRQKFRVSVKLFRQFHPGQPEIGGAHEHAGVGGIHHRGGDLANPRHVQHVHRISGRQ